MIAFRFLPATLILVPSVSHCFRVLPKSETGLNNGFASASSLKYAGSSFSYFARIDFMVIVSVVCLKGSFLNSHHSNNQQPERPLSGRLHPPSWPVFRNSSVHHRPGHQPWHDIPSQHESSLKDPLPEVPAYPESVEGFLQSRLLLVEPALRWQKNLLPLDA